VSPADPTYENVGSQKTKRGLIAHIYYYSTATSRTKIPAIFRQSFENFRLIQRALYIYSMISRGNPNYIFGNSGWEILISTMKRMRSRTTRRKGEIYFEFMQGNIVVLKSKTFQILEPRIKSPFAIF
jgi:hypothetical protein